MSDRVNTRRECARTAYNRTSIQQWLHVILSLLITYNQFDFVIERVLQVKIEQLLILRCISIKFIKICLNFYVKPLIQ